MPKLKETNFYVSGVCCAEEEIILHKKINSILEVKNFNYNLLTQKLHVVHTCDEKLITDTLSKAGFKVANIKQRTGNEKATTNSNEILLIIISGSFIFLGLALQYIGFTLNLHNILFIIAIVSGGYKIFIKGYRALMSLTLDMYFLMTIATIGAIVIGEYAEAAVVIFLFSLALLFENFSMERTRNAISSLIKLSPTTLCVKSGISEIIKPIESVSIGEIIIVRPGERVSLDGIIVNGKSYLNDSVITGESLPIFKQTGDCVYAGSINGKGSFEFRVTKLYQDTYLAHIINLIEESVSKKSKNQIFIEKFSRYYTPSVTILAVLISIIPPLLFDQAFLDWFYRALVLLVIACPCALVISTPVTIVSALTRAAKLGVLIKGGKYLEELGKIKALGIDKTGTLTEGKLFVEEIITFDSYSKRDLLKIAAVVESKSEHHLADAILYKANESNIDYQTVLCQDFVSYPGKGLTAKINGKNYSLGNHTFCKELNLCNENIESLINKLEAEGNTVVIVIENSTPIGIITVTDLIRRDGKKAISEIKKIGIQKIVMLTGDNEVTANKIASEIGIDDVYHKLLPEKKVEVVNQLKAKFGIVGMVGDGVNDAPALATANVSIAMGVSGTDTAIETANVVLMSDNLLKLPEIIKLSKKTIKILKQNIFIALFTKMFFLILGSLGIATLWVAILADDGAALIVILNALRLLKKID